jgi:hypothetical protein
MLDCFFEVSLSHQFDAAIQKAMAQIADCVMMGIDGLGAAEQKSDFTGPG